MSIKKKWSVLPFVLFAVLLIALIAYFALRKPSGLAEPLRAIPVDASVVVKINDFESLFQKLTGRNQLWAEMRTIAEIDRINTQLKFLDSLYRNQSEAKDILRNTPSFLSLHFSGRDKISVLHAFQLPPRYSPKKAINLINQLIVNAGTIKIRNYEGLEIHEVTLLNRQAMQNFSFSVYRDILMISFSTVLLEDAIRQLINNESLHKLGGFSEIYATAGKNVDANVFINFRQLPRSLSVFVKTDYKSEVRSFNHFAGWAEMDVNLLTDMILFNGFVNPPDSANSVASLMLSQAPQRFTSGEVLPASLASFLTIAISDAGSYMVGYRSLLREQGKLTPYQNTLSSLNNAYGTDFPGDLTGLIDKEITLGFDAGAAAGITPAVYFVMRVKSKTQAEEKLHEILTKFAAAESKQASAYTVHYRLDADLSYPIYHLPIKKLVSKVFGNLYAALDDHYYTVLDNYVVFSGSVESVKSLIHQYVLNKTLQNDQAYKAFKNNLTPRSNLVYYCNLGKGRQFFDTYLIQSLSDAWDKYLPVFQRVQVAGFQLNASNNMLYANVFAKYLGSYRTATQTVWESKLDTLADFKPVFVVNHNTQQNEVFVQDLQNNIYLINQAGRVLWKIRLPEPINSEVFQVDYFRNGKLQLLFSTRHELYLVDRKGNFVEKYPVKLRAPATCGVSVFDYDNNRDYRLFIACDDRHVYAYTKEGNLVQGWEFGTSESEVTQPVNHFRIGDKDFLVFGDRYKTYILDRRGKTRVSSNTFFERSTRNNYWLDLPPAGQGPALVTTDTTGQVYFIGFNGQVKTVRPPDPFAGQHYFAYADLNGDRKGEFIYLQDKKLRVYNHDFSGLFDYTFETPVVSRPQVYQFSATDYKLGVVSRHENHIYLFNNNGELYNGFPLQGNTPFSIGQFGDTLSRFNLIVGSNDNFLYNYRVK